MAVKEDIDLQHIISYPLPLPTSMSYVDGVMSKTSKSALLAFDADLEEPPSAADAIVDGSFQLHTMPSEVPSNYRGLARFILIKVTSCSKK